MTKSVQISKGLLWGLGSALGLSLLALAFLLGRQSAAPEKTQNMAISSTAPQTDLSQNSIQPSQSPAPRLSAPVINAAPVFEPEKAAAGQWGVPDQQRKAVHDYFKTLDQIQPDQFSGDAQSVAQEMAAAMAKGYTSGLDRLLSQAQNARSRLAAVNAPAPCKHHHSECVASLDDGLEMLRAIKQALSSQDPGALMSMATRAQGMKQRAEALQGEERRLREFYGVGK